MLKCTLRAPKTINAGIGEKFFFFEKTIFRKTFFLRNFFSPTIMSFATQV